MLNLIMINKHGQVKFWENGEAPPIFYHEGLTFLFIRRNSLLIVCTTRYPNHLFDFSLD
jgi:hypothetical protein